MQIKKYVCLLAGIGIGLLIFSTSCRTTALERRGFPLLAYATIEKDASGSKAVCIYYESRKDKVLDTNHVKVLVLSQDIIDSQSDYNKLMKRLWERDSIPRSALVCVVDGTDEWNLLQGGQWLEELLLTKARQQNLELVTAGELMNEWYNKRRSIDIPKLSLKDLE